MQPAHFALAQQLHHKMIPERGQAVQVQRAWKGNAALSKQTMGKEIWKKKGSSQVKRHDPDQYVDHFSQAIKLMRAKRRN